MARASLPSVPWLSLLAALALLPAAPAAQEGVVAERDGARVLGRMGLGTFSAARFDLPSDDLDVTTVPLVGVRWWLGGAIGVARAWGLDLGVGFTMETEELEGVELSTTGVGVHVGLPLVLAQLPHANFELVPEADFVLLSGEAEGQDMTGWQGALGARAGFELFFGFIGVPDLSLEATLGVGFVHAETRIEAPGGDREWSRTFVGFQKLNDPWDIFRTTVAARYYF